MSLESMPTMASDAELVSSINFATMEINRYVALVVLLFGTSGNFLNIWILSDQSLSNNPCSIYLWWSSICSVMFLWSGLPIRVLQGYNINWPNENQPFCKIRNYISTICFAMATWTLVGASIDRYLCSSVSVRYRQLSTVRTARRLLIITLSVFTLIFAEIFYCYEASVPNVPLPCYPESLSCQLYNNWMTILFINIIPSIFMAIFSLLTIRNIRARVVRPIKNRTVSINTSRNNLRVHINDRNISQMLLIQVLVLFLLNIPASTQLLYSSLTAIIPKSSLRLSIENLIYSVIVLLSCFSYSISFYLYTLTGPIFRTALKHSIRRLLRRIRLLH